MRFLSVAVVLLVGCSADAEPTIYGTAGTDSGVDATADAGQEAGEDTATDTGAGGDVAQEVGSDAHQDVAADEGADVHDAAEDVTTDAPVDAVVDSFVDSGPDPCEPPSPVGATSGGRYCTDECGFGPYGTAVSECAPYVECSSDYAESMAGRTDFSVLLPAEHQVHDGLDGNGVACELECGRVVSYAVPIPAGWCARFTSSGTRSFAVEPPTTAVQCADVADCLIVPSTPGNPPAIPSGAVVLALGAVDAPLAWVRAELDEDWSGHPCSLACP
jgi:hypothetical protein